MPAGAADSMTAATSSTANTATDTSAYTWRALLRTTRSQTRRDFWYTTVPSYFSKVLARAMTNVGLVGGSAFLYTLSNLTYASWAIALVAGAVGAVVEYKRPVQLMNKNDEYDAATDCYTIKKDGEADVTITHYRKKRAAQNFAKTAAKFFAVYMMWALGMGFIATLGLTGPAGFIAGMAIVGLYTAVGLYIGNTFEILIDKITDAWMGVLPWAEVWNEIQADLMKKVVSLGPLCRGFLEGFFWCGLELAGIFQIAGVALTHLLGNEAVGMAIGMVLDLAAVSFVVSTAFSVGAFIHNFYRNLVTREEDAKDYVKFKADAERAVCEMDTFVADVKKPASDRAPGATLPDGIKAGKKLNNTVDFLLDHRNTKFSDDFALVAKRLKGDWGEFFLQEDKGNLGFDLSQDQMYTTQDPKCDTVLQWQRGFFAKGAQSKTGRMVELHRGLNAAETSKRGKVNAAGFFNDQAKVQRRLEARGYNFQAAPRAATAVPPVA
jgi:hypothetical protein